MWRRLAQLVLIVLLALPASEGFGAPALVGGTQVQITAAPWTVVIRQTASTGILQCTGAVVDFHHNAHARGVGSRRARR